MSQSIFERRLTHRHALGVGLAAAVTLLPGCGCGSGADASVWTFVDDRKHKIRLSARPTRIVAYSTAAAALYEAYTSRMNQLAKDVAGWRKLT